MKTHRNSMAWFESQSLPIRQEIISEVMGKLNLSDQQWEMLYNCEQRKHIKEYLKNLTKPWTPA